MSTPVSDDHGVQPPRGLAATRRRRPPCTVLVLTIAAMGRTTTTPPSCTTAMSPASTRVHRAGRAATPHSMSSRTSRPSSTPPIPVLHAPLISDLSAPFTAGTSPPVFAGKAAQRQKVEANVLTKGFLPKDLVCARGCVVLRQPWHRSAHQPPTRHPYIPHFTDKRAPPPYRNPTLQTRPTRSSPTTLSPSMLPRRLRIPSTRTSSSSSSRRLGTMAPCSFILAVPEFQPLVAQAHTVKRGRYSTALFDMS
jgi:hypothetical protein